MGLFIPNLPEPWAMYHSWTVEEIHLEPRECEQETDDEIYYILFYYTTNGESRNMRVFHFYFHDTCRKEWYR